MYVLAGSDESIGVVMCLLICVPSLLMWKPQSVPNIRPILLQLIKKHCTQEHTYIVHVHVYTCTNTLMM